MTGDTGMKKLFGVLGLITPLLVIAGSALPHIALILFLVLTNQLSSPSFISSPLFPAVLLTAIAFFAVPLLL
jgi:hypothetical protein